MRCRAVSGCRAGTLSAAPCFVRCASAPRPDTLPAPGCCSPLAPATFDLLLWAHSKHSKPLRLSHPQIDALAAPLGPPLHPRHPTRLCYRPSPGHSYLGHAQPLLLQVLQAAVPTPSNAPAAPIPTMLALPPAHHPYVLPMWIFPPAHLAMAALGTPSRCSSTSCRLLCSSRAGMLGRK